MFPSMCCVGVCVAWLHNRLRDGVAPDTTGVGLASMRGYGRSERAASSRNRKSDKITKLCLFSGRPCAARVSRGRATPFQKEPKKHLLRTFSVIGARRAPRTIPIWAATFVLLLPSCFHVEPASHESSVVNRWKPLRHKG